MRRRSGRTGVAGPAWEPPWPVPLRHALAQREQGELAPQTQHSANPPGTTGDRHGGGPGTAWRPPWPEARLGVARVGSRPMSDEISAAGSLTPVALTIAGSDSGGGAGIQADLKAFAAAGVHGASAITALTAQNTVGVTRIVATSPEMIVAQVEAVVSDLAVGAVKIGMLATTETIEAVARALNLLPGVPVVHDPVMISESGARLLEEEALSALIELIIPRVTVITPNLSEARALVAGRGGATGRSEGAGQMTAAGDLDGDALLDGLLDLGPAWAMVTGGHRDEAVDLLAGGTPQERVRIAGPRHPDGAAHGSGCTHSSTLAAHLARGASVPEAARAARDAASRAVLNGLRDVGAGAGPVDVLGIASRRS